MRYLKAALVGLLSGVLVAGVVMSGVIVHGSRILASDAAHCAADGVCLGIGGAAVLIAFAVGFVAGFVGFLRRPRQVAP